MSTSETDGLLVIDTGDGLDKRRDVADVAEVSEGRLQVVTLDGETEMVDGHLFGGFGYWKMWLDDGRGIATVDPAFSPLTMPGDYIAFDYDGLRHEKYGDVLRLRRPDLD